MTTLNRSSFWTLHTGDRLRVKHMTIAQIQAALLKLDELQRDEIDNDPYLIQLLIFDAAPFAFYNEPVHKKDGFFLDEWHELFDGEIAKRIKFLARQQIRPADRKEKQSPLVNILKFW